MVLGLWGRGCGCYYGGMLYVFVFTLGVEKKLNGPDRLLLEI